MPAVAISRSTVPIGDSIRGRAVVRNDRKRLTLVPFRVELDYRLAEEWAAQNIDVVTRADGVEATSANNVPGRHLAHIVVTANAVHFCVIGLLQNTTNPFLRKPRLTGIHEQVRNMMDGFVGMVIVGFQPKVTGVFWNMSSSV